MGSKKSGKKISAVLHEAVRLDVLGGMSLAEAAARQGISLRTVKQWSKQEQWQKGQVIQQAALTYPKITEAAERRQQNTVELLATINRNCVRILGKGVGEMFQNFPRLSPEQQTGFLRLIRETAKDTQPFNEEVAGLLGDPHDGPQTQINILVNPDWQRLRAAILRALEPFPEARAALVAEIGNAEGLSRVE